MLFIVAGIATAFNLLIVYTKYAMRRYLDCVLDFTALVVLVYIFSGTGQGGIIIAMIASALISLSLLIIHPKWSRK
ncbi:hypothetical protein FACS189487_05400 [Campylobacterota bacterium]|nr:hypothetical protein FACS189487_05400 [Campylobacterota bacterium]